MALDELRTHARPALDPEIASELDNWEAEMGRFLSGELSPERWRAFRLAHGVYGQRQPNVQMIRVKIPTGVLTGRQVERLADISEEFSTGVAHLTTRQDVQFHFIPLERVPDLLRRLAEVSLTTREACGNSVRNTTACPLSGYIAEESFEVQPYAWAAHAFLIRNAFCQQMARKFKIAFSACPEDCAATAIHDIGALGRVVEEAGRTRYGFKIVVGGGLGAAPFIAKVLEEFVPLEELLPTIKAILQVYTDLGNRRNKGKARIKFVVHKLGIDRFRELVLEARAALTPEERAEAELRLHVPERSAELVAGHLSGSPSLRDIEAAQALAAVRPAIWAAEPLRLGSPDAAEPPRVDPDTFFHWQSTSVRPHRDRARAVVTVLFPLGDIAAQKLRALGRLVTAFGEDHACVGREQNLVLPSVKRSDLRELYRELAALGLAEAGVGTALDVTSCPGADTCQLGITSSKGLARAIRAELLPIAGNGGLDLLRGVTIKISGCPNSCGQHHIANIGFHGVVKKIHDRQVPAYQLHLGGQVGAGEARLGEATEKIPARNVPKVVAALLHFYGQERINGESFADFAGRLPQDRVKLLLKPFVEELPPDEELIVDWGQSSTFDTEDLGTGECAGAGMDVVVDPFDNYRAELAQTSLFMEHGQWTDALANLNRSQYTVARVLLEAIGKRPDSDYEVTCELRAQVIDRGHASEVWNELHDVIARTLRTKYPPLDAVRAIYGRSEELLDEFRRLLPILVRKKAASASSAEISG